VKALLRRFLEARVAAALTALYLAVAVVCLALPFLTGDALAGLWAYLLAMPWSGLMPIATLDRIAPAWTELLGPISVAIGLLANAALLYVGARWLELRRDGRRS